MSISFYLKNFFGTVSPCGMIVQNRKNEVAVISRKLGCNLKDGFRVVLETKVVLFSIYTRVYFYPNSVLLPFLHPKHTIVLLDTCNPLNIRFRLRPVSCLFGRFKPPLAEELIENDILCFKSCKEIPWRSFVAGPKCKTRSNKAPVPISSKLPASPSSSFWAAMTSITDNGTEISQLHPMEEV